MSKVIRILGTALRYSALAAVPLTLAILSLGAALTASSAPPMAAVTGIAPIVVQGVQPVETMEDLLAEDGLTEDQIALEDLKDTELALAPSSADPLLPETQDAPDLTGIATATALPSKESLFNEAFLSSEELRCLALNVYWEARSEPLEGQVAVAAVTLNRVAHPAFPDTVCGVVFQGGEWRRHRCQFSWWCDGKSDKPKDDEAWARSETIALLTMLGRKADPTGGALFYHADYVAPVWAKTMRKLAKIGRHIYYHPARDPKV